MCTSMDLLGATYFCPRTPTCPGCLLGTLGGLGGVGRGAILFKERPPCPYLSFIQETTLVRMSSWYTLLLMVTLGGNKMRGTTAPSEATAKNTITLAGALALLISQGVVGTNQGHQDEVILLVHMNLGIE